MGLRLEVLGASGAWPAGEACSGYLVEAEGFRLLLDVGYGVVPVLLRRMGAESIDAVLVSHGHPDHCADLNPLLRARALGERDPPPLAVYALPGALDPVLSLDKRGMLDAAYVLRQLEPGTQFRIGPFDVDVLEVPHFVPAVGLRLASGEGTLAYTGDAGASTNIAALARDSDVFLAEATYPLALPTHSLGRLSTARDAGLYAAEARAKRLVLTHLWPGTPREVAKGAASQVFEGRTQVARTGLVVEL